MGAIVHARLANRWDDGVAEACERLWKSTLDSFVHLQQETARITFDLLSCANLDLSKRARDYLSGQTKELPVDVSSVLKYRQLVELCWSTVAPPKKEEEKSAGREEEGDDMRGLSSQDQLKLLAQRARGNMRIPVDNA